MAAAGVGDVLTGCLLALVAQGLRAQLDLWPITGLAVQVHALAADQLVAEGVGPIGLTPSEVARRIRQVLNAAAAGR
jgi:NAD(P)H-hydrate repair Nnr-like enzyme with NAD(P)H-hydrate dehydratase domain